MSYDNWKTSCPEQDEVRAQSCPVCTGDEDAAACSEECNELIQRCERERKIARLYRTAHTTLSFAHIYKADGGPEDRRLKDCVRQVSQYRAQIRKLREAA